MRVYNAPKTSRTKERIAMKASKSTTNKKVLTKKEILQPLPAFKVGDVVKTEWWWREEKGRTIEEMDRKATRDTEYAPDPEMFDVFGEVRAVGKRHVVVCLMYGGGCPEGETTRFSTATGRMLEDYSGLGDELLKIIRPATGDETARFRAAVREAWRDWAVYLLCLKIEDEGVRFLGAADVRAMEKIAKKHVDTKEGDWYCLKGDAPAKERVRV